MKSLVWVEDVDTKNWAIQCNPLTMSAQPQYDGSNYNMREATWTSRILAPRFPDFCRLHRYSGDLRPSPENIVRCWQAGCELEALAMTVSWGNMSRTCGSIYQRDLPDIRAELQAASASILQSNSVEQAWRSVTSKLGWSIVMTSKCLHFLARSLGYEENTLVAIDNQIILKRVAPKFDAMIRSKGGNPSTLRFWNDRRDSWAGYNRYMTAILSWSRLQGWTTTQVESTLFRQFSK